MRVDTFDDMNIPEFDNELGIGSTVANTGGGLFRYIAEATTVLTSSLVIFSKNLW